MYNIILQIPFSIKFGHILLCFCWCTSIHINFGEGDIDTAVSKQFLSPVTK